MTNLLNGNRESGIRSWSAEDRPREKMISQGRSALSDSELLAILINSGTASLTALDVARNLLAGAGNNLNHLARLTLQDLCRVKGIGKARALTLMAALELGRRRDESRSSHDSPAELSTPDRVWAYMKPVLLDQTTEQFWIILLNQALGPISRVRVADGGIAQVLVDLRVVFREALAASATQMILVHNHPSGRLVPSTEDRTLTSRICEAGKLMQIRILDHLIFADSGYYSFAQSGELP